LAPLTSRQAQGRTCTIRSDPSAPRAPYSKVASPESAAGRGLAFCRGGLGGLRGHLAGLRAIRVLLGPGAARAFAGRSCDQGQAARCKDLAYLSFAHCLPYFPGLGIRERLSKDREPVYRIRIQDSVQRWRARQLRVGRVATSPAILSIRMARPATGPVISTTGLCAAKLHRVSSG